MQVPLEIDRIESSRVNADHVRLRLSGRWLDPAGAGEEELLVVQIEGRRHRFPGVRRADADHPDRWSATFTLPVWAEPRLEGQAALWIGNSLIPVSPPRGGKQRDAVAPALTPAPEPEVALPTGTTLEPDPAPEPEPAPQPEPAPEPEPAPDRDPVTGHEPGARLDSDYPDTPRSGPLADLLLKETVAALHAELEDRTADAARMRGALADAQSELDARSAMQAALEVTHGELRVELERLTGAVERRRNESDGRVAEAERAQAEAGRRLAALEAALEQRAAGQAQVSEQLAGLQAAADRRAYEVGRLREELAAVSVARDAAVSEVAGLRSELGRLGTELAATRERVGAEGGDLGSAHRLLADARALAEQLRGQ